MKSTTLKREIDVVVYDQSLVFRTIKWVIILIVLFLLYRWKGWNAVVIAALAGSLLGLTVHFFYRKKTHAWKRAWGGFKPRKTVYH